MRSRTMLARARSAGLICGVGVLCQFGGCELGTITTSMTLNGRDAIIQLVRGAVLTPIDAFITDAVNQAFGADED